MTEFVPQNDDEEQWTTYDLLKGDDLKGINKVDVVFSNGIFVPRKSEYYNASPPYGRRIFLRAILYGFRDLDLNRDIHHTDLYEIVFNEQERTRRAIEFILQMKYPYEEKKYQRFYEYMRQYNWKPFQQITKRNKSNDWELYVTALKDLHMAGIVIYLKIFKNNKVRRVIKLTDYGKQIVIKHRDEHLLF